MISKHIKKIVNVFTIFVFTLLVLIDSGLCTNYWIDINQNGDGLSRNNASGSWDHLRMAHTIVAGDTIIFLPGDYGRISIGGIKGIENNPIVMVSDIPHTAKFSGGISFSCFFVHLKDFYVERADGHAVIFQYFNNTIEGFEIKNVPDGSGVSVYGQNNRIISCEIHSVHGNGLAINASSNTLVERCYLHDIDKSGLFIYPTAHDVTIKNNKIFRVAQIDLGGHGIYSKGTSAGNIIIEDNEIIDTNFGNTLSFRGPGIIRRNILAGSAKNGIYLLDDTGKNPGANVLIQNNIIYDQAWCAIRVGNNIKNWQIKIYNNTFIGRTASILLQQNSTLQIEISNNIFDVTGPPVINSRPECELPVAAFKTSGSANSKIIQNNLFYNRYTVPIGGFTGNDNIEADPLFIDFENENFQLQELSPAIDAGLDTTVFNDAEDPNNPGSPLGPAKGGLRNDIGVFGGPGLAEWPVNEPPSDFMLFSPINNATLVHVLPEVKWKHALDFNVGDKVHYCLYMDTDSTFHSPMIYDKIKENGYQFETELNPNEKYYWKVIAFDGDSLSTPCLENYSFTTGSATSIENNRVGKAFNYQLLSNYPNPFNAETIIKYQLTDRSQIKIDIYNNQGQLLETLFNGEQKKGLSSHKWIAQEYPSGLYFCVMQVRSILKNPINEYNKVLKILLLK